jgi:hypothetical protein
MRKLLRCFILITFILLGLDNNLYGFQYMGEVTWSYHRTQSLGGPVDQYYIIKCAISYVANSYYIIQGSATYPAQPGEKSLILSGSAILQDSNIVMTLHGAQPLSTSPWGPGADITAIYYGSIDKTTLNGTVWGNIWGKLTNSATTYADYTAGTLTCTSNPIQLTPSTVPQVQLLLSE